MAGPPRELSLVPSTRLGLLLIPTQGVPPPWQVELAVHPVLGSPREAQRAEASSPGHPGSRWPAPRALLQCTLTGRWTGCFLCPSPSPSVPGEPSSKDWRSPMRPKSQDPLQNLPQLMQNENVGPCLKLMKDFKMGPQSTKPSRSIRAQAFCRWPARGASPAGNELTWAPEEPDLGQV